MIPKSVIDQTIGRFTSRTTARTETAEKLRTGSPATADSPLRVHKRMIRLARAEVAASPAAALTGLAAPTVALERVLGASDLMSVSFLERAVSASRTVARIRIRSADRTIGYGTGSLVAPRVLITNNHVLGSAAEAAGSLAEFNYQDGSAAPTVFALDPASLFVTDAALDFTIVAVQPRSGSQAVSDFGFNRLIAEEGKVLVGEALNIIQHPNGELKQVALRENQLQDVLPEFLHYHTDTAPGSSGSPVYNDQWEMVALHHSGVPRTDAMGRYLTKDGTLWDESMGEQAIDWIANEGVRVSRIVASIGAQSLSGPARALRDSILAAEALPSADVTAAAPVAVAPSPQPPTTHGRTDADGFATWTVPIEIKLRVGGGIGDMVAPATSPVTPSVVVQPPVPAPAAPDLQAALHAVEAGQTQTYYDAARDASDRDAYYQGVDEGGTAAARFEALSHLLESTHQPRPSYKPALHVYPFVDLHPDRKLRSIYSQKTFTPEELVREDFGIEEERARRREALIEREGSLTPAALERLEALLEADLPFNCEHVVPQSWFGKQEPMRGDLHHLFACESGCNSFRGNIPYFDFPDFEEAVRTECGKRDGTRFEPGAAKGIVARATLYFLLRYPRRVNTIVASYDASRLATLLSWHATHPVTDYEHHRNMAIFAAQGNRNPLIDHPEWATEIDYTKGL